MRKWSILYCNINIEKFALKLPTKDISMNPIYTTTYLNEAPPPVQQEKNDVVLNFTLTIPESIFLAFSSPMIQSMIDKQANIIYLSTAEKMQSSFTNWTERTFKAKKFTPEELNLATIVLSVWAKTKSFVDNELNVLNDPVLINDEEIMKADADKAAADLSLQGHTGKAFTLRQANMLLAATNNIAK